MALGLDDASLAGANTPTPVIPASNLKVVTATAAVEVLGAGTVFTTNVVGPRPSTVWSTATCTWWVAATRC